MTPLAERHRGHRFATTAGWYVLGATLGGLTLGLGAAVLAALVGATGPGGSAALALGGVVALAAAASDTASLRFTLPGHRRQVNEDWIEAYRPWVYGLGFGWQIGTGLATYIRTAGVYVLVALGALTGSPAAALLGCTLFGLARGLAILAALRCTDPDALLRFHQRFAAAAPVSREVTATALGGVGLALVTTSAPVLALLIGCALVVGGALRLRGPATAEQVPQRI